METEEEKVVDIDADIIEEEKENSILKSVANRFMPMEEPLPEKANMEAMIEMLGRIEHELVIYRRERVYKTYLWAALLMLPILGLGYLIPSFIKSVQI